MAPQKDVHNRQNLQNQLMICQERGLEMYCRTIITLRRPPSWWGKWLAALRPRYNTCNFCGSLISLSGNMHGKSG